MANRIGRIAHAQVNVAVIKNGTVIEVDKDLANFSAEDMIVLSLPEGDEITLHVEEAGTSEIKVGGTLIRDYYWVFSLIYLTGRRWRIQLEPHHVELLKV